MLFQSTMEDKVDMKFALQNSNQVTCRPILYHLNVVIFRNQNYVENLSDDIPSFPFDIVPMIFPVGSKSGKHSN